MPKISVIIPVYNVEKYLHTCLDSILAQTFTDFELILIDDGSPDSSGKICDEYAEKDSRIRVFHQENQGQAAARNFGVNQAKADWIHFVDSDDIIHPQMLEILFDGVVKSNCNISMCGYISGDAIPEAFDAHITKYDVCQTVVTDEYLLSLLKDGSFRYHCIWAKIIKKDILLKFPFEAGRTREDSAVVCKWLYEAGRIADINYPMYFYLYNPNGTVNSGFSKKSLDILWAWNQQIKFFKEINYKYSEVFCRAGCFWDECFLCYKMRQNKKQFIFELVRSKVHASLTYVINRKQIVEISRVMKLDILFHLEMLYPRVMQIYWIIRNKLPRRRK